MKPVELRISGWGPYKELQTIDFTRMGGTRAVPDYRCDRSRQDDDFDAIMYALYGCMSGGGTGKGIGAFGLCKAGYAHLCGAVDDT